MDSTLVGTSATAREVLKALLHSDHVTETLVRDFHCLIRKHDFSQPLARGRAHLAGEEVILEGNHLSYGERGAKASLHILADGSIIQEQEHDLSIWKRRLEERGWKVEYGNEIGLHDPGAAPGHEEGRRIHLREVQVHGNIRRVFACLQGWEPDGRQITITVRTRSHADGGHAADRMAEGIIMRERGIPGSPDAAIDLAKERLTREIEEMRDLHAPLPPYGFRFPSWREGLIEIETLDSMLEPFSDCILATMEVHPHLEAPQPNKETLSEIETKIRLHAKRHALAKGRGTIITSLGKAILENNGRDPRKITKWRTHTNGDLRTREKLVIRDGVIGGELIVEKDKRRILRLLNATFELPRVEIPHATMEAMVGKRLREFVEHPRITDDMIIRSVKRARQGIRGSLKDEGRIRYEAA